MNFDRLLHATLPIALVILILAPLAHAGPPLICRPFDIGDAKSLPFGRQNWHDRSPDYDTARLVQDTLALLGPQTPVLVRMETLRRAAIYAESNPRISEELAGKLMARAKSAGDAPALFDAGYLLETYRELGSMTRRGFVASAGNGYTLVQRALKLRGNDAEMEFAAALIAQGHRNGMGREHLRRALAGAREGSLLARNLVSHAQIFGMLGTNVLELRASLNITKD
jgi:hypothetical protein